MARAQAEATNGPPVTPPQVASIWSPILDALSHSNLVAATYMMADTTDGTFGGGAALGYRLNDFMVPFFRADYTHGHIWTLSGSLQLQAPIYFGATPEKPKGKVTLTPFAVAGVATSFNADNGVVSIAGVGLAARASDQKWGVIMDYEWWNGGPFKNNCELRFGPYILF